MLEERAATWPRQWMAEGFKKGQAKGRAEGHAAGHESGLREALAEQAHEKFGSLDSRHARMIAEAPEAQLKRWLKRILSAGTPEDLFEI